MSPRMNLCQQQIENVISNGNLNNLKCFCYLIIRSTTVLTRDSVMLGTILASKSRTKSSVTPGLDRSAISKACSNSSSGLLPVPPLPPRNFFDSCETKQNRLIKSRPISLKFFVEIRQQGEAIWRWAQHSLASNCAAAAAVARICEVLSSCPARHYCVDWDP